MSEAPLPGPVLKIRNLTIDLTSKSAQRKRAVDCLDLQVNSGEIVCVVGESGSGKSMTAHAAMGLLPPHGVKISSGEILLNGRNVVGLGERAMRAIRGRDVAMVFQEPLSALNPLHRVGRQVEEVFKLHTELTGDVRKQRTLDLLESMGLPDPQRIARSYPFQLSGGQRQRVMIAMALALRPSLLIADEPTTALDVTAQMQILRLIQQLQRETGMGVLFITHDFGVVAEIADRVVVLNQGQKVEEGAVATLLRSPAHDYTRQLIEAVPPIEARPQRDAVDTAGAPLLEIRGVNKCFQLRGLGRSEPVWAAKNLFLSVRKGETVGIVGESGSGKSTMARCIVKLENPDSGEILLDGHDVGPLSGRGLLNYRKRVQMVFQDPYSSLNPRQRVGDIIADGPVAHGIGRAEARNRGLKLLELVGLDAGAAARYPHEFSGGQRQRVGLARALALEPDLIVADEPVSALDVSVQAQVLELLEEVQQRLGLSIVLITHDLRVAAQVCDRIAVMLKGEIVEQGLAADVFSAPKHPYTRALLDAVPGRKLLQGYIGDRTDRRSPSALDT